MKRLKHPSAFLNALLVGLLCAVFITLSIFRSEEQMRSDHFTYSEYRQAGDTAGAIRIIDAMLKRDKRNPILYANKAFAMLAADTCAEDAVAWLEGLPFRTHVPEPIREALSLFHEASRLSPADPVFLHNKGWLSFAAGDTAQAIRYLHRAIALSPFDPVCLVSCGLLTGHTADSARAGDYYIRALSVNPSLWDTPFFGWLRTHRQQQSDRILTGAARSVANELAQEPENGIIQSRLAKLRYAQGNIPAALSLLQNVTRTLPNLNRSWMLLGQIKEQETDLAAAEECYKKAMFLDGNDPLPPLYLAKLLERRQDTAQATILYRRAEKNMKSYRTVYWQITVQTYGLRSWTNEYYPGWLLPLLTIRH